MVFLWNCRHKKVLFKLLLIICTFMWWCLSILGKYILTHQEKLPLEKIPPPPSDFLEKLILTLPINPLGTQPLVFIIWSLMSGNKVFKITRKTRKRKICTLLLQDCLNIAQNLQMWNWIRGEVRQRGKGRVIGRRRGEIKIYKVKGG